mmetsp:Transcript_73625/g.204651  ORF Transcript_73625/g.204651 Transcript_73625/m.204651 type:complete len:428 (+) Transcript_73625:568-1851(+)
MPGPVPTFPHADLQVGVRDDPSSATRSAKRRRVRGHESVPWGEAPHHVHQVGFAVKTKRRPVPRIARVVSNVVDRSNAALEEVLLCVLRGLRWQRGEATWDFVNKRHIQAREIMLQVASPFNTMVVGADHERQAVAVVRGPELAMLLDDVSPAVLHEALVIVAPCARFAGRVRTRRLPERLPRDAGGRKAAPRRDDAEVVSQPELAIILSQNPGVARIQLHDFSPDEFHVAARSESILVAHHERVPRGGIRVSADDAAGVLGVFLRVHEDDVLVREFRAQLLNRCSPGHAAADYEHARVEVRKNSKEARVGQHAAASKRLLVAQAVRGPHEVHVVPAEPRIQTSQALLELPNGISRRHVRQTPDRAPHRPHLDVEAAVIDCAILGGVLGPLAGRCSARRGSTSAAAELPDWRRQAAASRAHRSALAQ